MDSAASRSILVERYARYPAEKVRGAANPQNRHVAGHCVNHDFSTD